MSRVTEKSKEILSESSEKILNAITANPQITVRELSGLMRTTTRATEKTISKPKSLGPSNVSALIKESIGKWLKNGWKSLI
jgi:predicted HTH transcriptional regulator